jgi:hypothetical protein
MQNPGGAHKHELLLETHRIGRLPYRKQAPARPSRPGSSPRQAAIDACPRCDAWGQYEIDGRYALCRHDVQRDPSGIPAQTAPSEQPPAPSDAAATRQVAGVVEAVGHTVAARGMCCVFGDPGLGKTVVVEQAVRLLPGRVPVWRVVAGVAPALPHLRAALCEALGLPSGALSHRAGPAGQALAWALAEPGVLVVDLNGHR